MNDLSWLIYLADVVSNLSTTLTWFGALSVAITVLLVIVGFARGDVYPFRSDKIKAAAEDIKNKLHRYALKVPLIVIPIVLIVYTLVPERQTIMMIAASEFGEEIATSAEAKDLGGKAYKSLDKFLSDYLEEAE